MSTDVPSRPQIAVILTRYGATNHGFAICSKLMEGLEFDGYRQDPRCDVVAIHLMEIGDDDVGVETARRNGVPMYHSVAAALCLSGNELAVDGVVIVGEHGDYPINERGQKLYPRRELFDQVLGVFRQAGRVVPVFVDKHLSWNWAWAQYMWAAARELDIPLMAGSSLPYASYQPHVQLPDGQQLDHVMAFGYAPERLEAYGFHALETAQFVLERRHGGEVGADWVQCLSGGEVWRAQQDGRWPADLAEAALATVRHPVGRPTDYEQDVYALDVGYRDGQRATTLITGGYSTEWGFGYRIRGESEAVAASTALDDLPRLEHFSALVRAIEELFLTGSPPAPAERTLLTTGLLSYLVESHYRGGVRIPTPDLDISYHPTPLPTSWTEVLR